MNEDGENFKFWRRRVGNQQVTGCASQDRQGERNWKEIQRL